MAEVPVGTHELPLYLAEPDDPARGDDSSAGGHRPAVPHGLAVLGRAAHGLSERLATPQGGSSPPGGYETRRSVVIHITRHLVMAPASAAAAFDEWLATGALTATPRGSLRVASPTPPGPSRLRAVPGQLLLRLSPVALPVELELVGWGEWRAALTLHPVRRFGWTVAPHRRTRYFAAGHATMDVIVRRLRTLAGDDGQHPYDDQPCAPSSSTRTPVPTA
ncbi:MAG TPA: hypothetical protein VF076_06895 [Acidimicrobiales bacterium]